MDSNNPLAVNAGADFECNFWNNCQYPDASGVPGGTALSPNPPSSGPFRRPPGLARSLPFAQAPEETL